MLLQRAAAVVFRSIYSNWRFVCGRRSSCVFFGIWSDICEKGRVFFFETEKVA